MDRQESIIVKQWRRHLSHTQEFIALDGRTREAKKRYAQRNLILSMASDEDLEEMARLEADLFGISVEQSLKDLKEARELHRKTVSSWRKDLGRKELNGKRKNL